MCIFYNSAPDARFAGTAPKAQYVQDRNFRTMHVRLQLDIDAEKKSVNGECITTFRSLNGKDSLVMDAVDFAVISVKDGKGKEMKNTYDGKKLTVTTRVNPDDIITVAVKYKLVEPKLGIYFTGPDKFYPNRPVQIWSHSETEDARYWFPVQDLPDEKTTSETIITVPAAFTVVSNGVLLKAAEKAKRKTFHWKMSKPHSPYLINFCAGEFDEVKDSWKGIPVTYYCEKGRSEDIKRAFGKTPQIIDFFSKKTGVKYPYEKYAQIAVTDFLFGGMEHTTSTTMTDIYLHDEKAHEEVQNMSDGLCAHELAHQWFGDLVTCRDWSHGWLNESFATYFDALFAQHDKGEEYFLYRMDEDAKEYFAEDKDKWRRPIVTNLFRRSGDLFDRHLYEKGACVLRMLHNMLGDELWWKAINNYLQKNRDRSVETLDLIKAVEETTGHSVKKFFDQWVFGAGHPEFKVLYHWSGSEAVLRISQNQTDNTVFEVNMTVEFTTKNGVKKFTELLDQKEKQLVYKLDSEPLMLRVDPDNVILKKMETIKPKKMWLYQLQFDPNPVGRVEAAKEIAKENATEKDAEILGKAMLNDKFWAVQAEIAILLGHIRNKKAVEYMKKGLEMRHPLARRAAVAAIGSVKDASIAKDLKPLLDDKNSYLVPAEVCRTLGKTKDPSIEPIIQSMLNKEAWFDCIRAGAVEGLAHLHGEEAVELLLKYSKPGHFSRTRMMAIRHLPIYGKGRKEVLDTLIELTKDKFALVQLVAASALGDMQDERAVPVLEELIKDGHESRLQRIAEDAIKKIYPWLDTDMETYRNSKKLEEKNKAEPPVAKKKAK
jgi:aminopeptidase N